MSCQRRALSRRTREGGLTVIEILIAAGLFALLSAALAMALKQSSSMWISNSSQLEAAERLRKVSVQLERDFPMARLQNSRTSVVPASFSSGGYDGDAVWFLSHINPNDGKAYLLSDGTPFWQCQILYYCVVPNQVESLAGGSLGEGKNSDGYEDRCPYKVLIRKVIDAGAAANPTEESTQETLLTNIDPYLSRPNGYDTSAMLSEPGVVSANIVASQLLFFRVRQEVSPPRHQFDIRAVSLAARQKVARTSFESLLESPYTLQSLVDVKARN